MSAEIPAVVIRTSPHFKKRIEVDTIMLNVVYALLPVAAFAVLEFGVSALALLVTTTAAAVLTEAAACALSGKPNSTRDYSAVITGLLLGLTLPPGFPLWMAAVGGIISILLGKLLFGGIGFNVFNPALVGRAFLQASFPVAITTWTPSFMPGRFAQFIPSTLAVPFTKPAPVAEWANAIVADGWSGATPLMLQKFDQLPTDLYSLFIGMTAGSAGESSSLIILVCGAYLVARRMMDWRIPASMIAGGFLMAAFFHWLDPVKYAGPLFTIFAGGFMLGAVFMASDMVASPVTPLGVWIYGAFIGVITVIIRALGGLSEGVMYAILLGNAVSCHIDALTQPRIYGARKKPKRAAKVKA